MMKKLLILLLCFMMTGCSSNTASSIVVEESQAEIEARQLISILNMDNEDMQRVKDRVVLGMVFSGDKDVVKDSCMYRSNEEGNYDTVGVFYSDNMESLKSYIEDYLSTLKSDCNKNYPQEVFKISNAIISNNDDTLILIIATDIESAKEEVNNILLEGEGK